MTNGFKELDLIDRVPEKLWTEVHDIEQETVIKTIPKKINAKRLSAEALQIAEKRRDKKTKPTNTKLNTHFKFFYDQFMWAVLDWDSFNI